jgi:signal transduction histidine kinase
MPEDVLRTPTAASGDARLDAIVAAGLIVAGSLDLNETLQHIVEAARGLTGAGYAALGVLGPDRRITRFLTSGLTPEQIERIGDYPTGRGILGAVISDEAPLRLRDLATDPRSVGFPPHHPPMTSFLGVPVRAHGRVFGNLYLTEAPSGEFSARDEQLLVLLAAQAGVAIGNAQAYEHARVQAEEARRSARARASLSDVAATILRERDAMKVMERLASEARDLVSARLVGIGLPEGLGTTMRFPIAVGERAEELRGREAPVDGLISGSSLMAGLPVRLAEGEAEAGVLRPIVPSRTQLVVPVVADGEPVAVIVAIDSSRVGGFTQDDQELLESLADLGAIGFEAARAFQRERVRSEAIARLRQLESESEARREGLRRVVEMQEQERRRIAQDLHDTTAGALAAIRMSLKQLERDIGAEHAGRVQDARNDIALAIDDLRDLIADLRPKVLDDFGLQPALERLCDTVARRGDVPVRFEAIGDASAVPPDVATAAYRIVQESLTNALRHASAHLITVTSRTDDERLVVTVEDDGVGVRETPGPSGYGLGGMQERAAMVSGGVRLERPAAGGTRVRFEVRLHRG